MKRRLCLKAGDIMLMSAILLLAVFLFISPLFFSPAEYAEIYTAENGKTQIVRLNAPASYKITSRGVELKVRVENAKVFVENSSCRDGICENTPAISRAGQTIICAPAGVVVRIIGKEAHVDGISG